MPVVTFPQVALVQTSGGSEPGDVRVLVCFTDRPAAFTSSSAQPGVRYGRELAACAAVIAAAIRVGNCAIETRVVHFKRRRGITRVMVVSEHAPGRTDIRTGSSRRQDRCWAAAEACLDALFILPAPDPRQVGLWVRL